MALTDTERQQLQRAYKDAAAKVAALPARIKDEEQQSEADRREPLPIEPLTGVAAPLVVKAIADIKGTLGEEAAGVIASQQKACSAIGTARVYLRSDHLKTILEAAGFGTNAPVS